MTAEIQSELGLTSQQILAAPQDAVYVAVHAAHVMYVKHLAERLNRQDLRVVSPGWLANSYRGLKSVVVDHAVHIGVVPAARRPDWRRAIDRLRAEDRLVLLSDIYKTR